MTMRCPHSLLISVAVFSTAVALSGCKQESESPQKTVLPLEELRGERSRLAHKKRRVIMNNDGNEPVTKSREVTRDALLNPRTAALAGSQVDAIFYSSSHGFSIVTHDTKVGTVWSYKGPGSSNLTPDFIKAGLDPLRVFGEFARTNGIELFWSFRVDDTHDAGRPVSFENNPFKVANPDLLMGTKDDPPLARGAWSAVDYGKEKVREMAFRLSEEVCRNHDVDGIEWDFWRHTVYFKNSAMLQPCTQEQLDQMTGLIRRVRMMTEEEGRKRGRPILFAVRVPDSLEYCRAIGLDVERWLKEDLVDLLITSGYTQMNPWEYSAQLAKKYGKPFYASLDDCRIKGDENASAMRATPLARRARAMEAWRAGADGLYTFNLFDQHNPFWREAGDPEELNGMDKDYFSSFRGTGRAYGLPYKPYMNVSILTPQDPLPLSPGQTVSVPLPMCDDFKAATARGLSPSTTLRLQFSGNPPGMQYSLNDRPLSAPVREGDWLVFDVDPAFLAKGDNLVNLQLPADAAPGLKLKDLLLQVRYHPK